MRTVYLIIVLITGIVVVAYYTNHPWFVPLAMTGTLADIILGSILYNNWEKNHIPEEAKLELDGHKIDFRVHVSENGLVTQEEYYPINFRAGKSDASPLAIQVWHEVHNNPLQVTGSLTFAGEVISVTCNKFVAGAGHHYHGEFNSAVWKGTFSFYTKFNGWEKKPTIHALTPSA